MLTNRVLTPRLSWLLTIVLAGASAARADGPVLVVCAPGYPGSTAEAQPAMDGLAAAMSAAAGWDAGAIEATYFETEEGGVARLREPDAVLALATLPFFLEHRAELDLRPKLLAVASDRQPLEPWFLVTGAGSVKQSGDLEGWELASLAGHSPRFVRGPALGEWGELPRSLTISFSGAILSGLRRAARGDRVALLLDADQAASLERLPFAAQLEVVHRSQLLPVSVLCSVGDRLAPDRLSEMLAVLEGIDELPAADEALAGVRLDRFEPVEPAVLERAERSFSEVRE